MPHKDEFHDSRPALPRKNLDKGVRGADTEVGGGGKLAVIARKRGGLREEKGVAPPGKRRAGLSARNKKPTGGRKKKKRRNLPKAASSHDAWKVTHPCARATDRGSGGMKITLGGPRRGHWKCLEALKFVGGI